jgi:hypothetical protein
MYRCPGFAAAVSPACRSLPTSSLPPVIDAAPGEIEFRPRTPGPLFEWVRRVSYLELAIFAGLLVVWAIPGLAELTFLFGLAHGIGYLALCLLLWIAILKREAPFWLFAATLTPVGPVGSVIGIAWIDRRVARQGTPELD